MLALGVPFGHCLSATDMKTVAVRRVCIPVTSPDPAPVVLVALGDADLRAAASRVLDRAGCRVLTARHSGHAVLASLTGGRIDVLLTDLAMEDGSGPALAERLRRHNPDLRGIYFSDDPLDAADDVLVRPATADDLLAALGLERAL